MNCCNEATIRHFGEEHAQEDLLRYLQKGPDRTTSVLMEMLSTLESWGSSLLDVGGGIGVIPFELAANGAEKITFVDLSPSYIKVAETEAKRRGIDKQIEFITGDFVDNAEHLPQADLVTLDRVVCCYSEFEQLITLSAAKALRWYALSFPCDRWYVKFGTAFKNWNRLRRGDTFRTYVHPEIRIHKILRAAGLGLHAYRRLFFWQVYIYRRRHTT